MAPHQRVGELIQAWSLPTAARLGSSVRSKGIYLEVRARLAVAAKRALAVKAGELTLRMPQGATEQFAAAVEVVSKILESIESLPVIPREIEDILGISRTERHRWLKDGRLPSAGTRTVNLRGRARKITFHVFDPRVVEDILERNAVDEWREEDAQTAVENRRRAAWKRRLTRSHKNAGEARTRSQSPDDDGRSRLQGWSDFERDGPI